MTTHTTTADENGNFSIALESALVSGETIEITAQKDGQSKSINIQAPSEPYLPPTENSEEISAGFVIDFPPNSNIFSRITSYPQEYVFSDVLLYTSAALSLKKTGSLSLVKNKIMPVINRTTAYIAFRIPLREILSANPPAFGYVQGYYDVSEDAASYGDISDVPLSFFKNMEFAFIDYTVDDKYAYFVMSNDFQYTPESDSFTDGVYNYCYKVIYGSQEYEVRFKFGHPE